MDRRVNVRQALRVFNTVLEKGTNDNGRWRYRGLTAEPSYDGYTVTLSDQHVTLNVYFHNKYQLDFKSTAELDQFLDLLAVIDRK